jgi:hypothetical protein
MIVKSATAVVATALRGPQVLWGLKACRVCRVHLDKMESQVLQGRWDHRVLKVKLVKMARMVTMVRTESRDHRVLKVLKATWVLWVQKVRKASLVRTVTAITAVQLLSSVLHTA